VKSNRESVQSTKTRQEAKNKKNQRDKGEENARNGKAANSDFDPENGENPSSSSLITL
jgi:hypothetical protein